MKNNITFYKPVSLGWPAQATWPKFLREVHHGLAQALGMGYADKDIVYPSDFIFVDPEENRFPQAVLQSFTLHMMRFNERYVEARCQKFKIEVVWYRGEYMAGFNYELLQE